jgi:hypothetical protein
MSVRERITSRRADRAYGVRNGTCAGLWRSGLVGGRKERGRGKAGYILKLFVDDLNRYFCGGPQTVPPTQSTTRRRCA